jgi:hypothetical protein
MIFMEMGRENRRTPRQKRFPWLAILLYLIPSPLPSPWPTLWTAFVEDSETAPRRSVGDAFFMRAFEDMNVDSCSPTITPPPTNTVLTPRTGELVVVGEKVTVTIG